MAFNGKYPNSKKSHENIFSSQKVAKFEQESKFVTTFTYKKYGHSILRMSASTLLLFFKTIGGRTRLIWIGQKAKLVTTVLKYIHFWSWGKQQIYLQVQWSPALHQDMAQGALQAHVGCKRLTNILLHYITRTRLTNIFYITIIKSTPIYILRQNRKNEPVCTVQQEVEIPIKT